VVANNDSKPKDEEVIHQSDANDKHVVKLDLAAVKYDKFIDVEKGPEQPSPSLPPKKEIKNVVPSYQALINKDRIRPKSQLTELIRRKRDNAFF
jgi:hypothetical protein